MYELTHSFKVSKLTTIERLKIEACDYWGINSSNYELYYISKNDNSEYIPIGDHKDCIVDTYVRNNNITEVIFYLLNNNSKLINSEIKESDIPISFSNIKTIGMKQDEDLKERVKILSRYHGVNVRQ